MKAKNDAIAAENRRTVFRYEGEQKVYSPRRSRSPNCRAQAQKQSQILAAAGEARSIELRTAAEAQGIRVRGDAQGKRSRYRPTLAQRWSGHPPQTILGEHVAVPFFNLGNNGMASTGASLRVKAMLRFVDYAHCKQDQTRVLKERFMN